MKEGPSLAHVVLHFCRMRVPVFVLVGACAIGCSLSPNIDLPSKDGSGDGTVDVGDGDHGGIDTPPSTEQPSSGPGGTTSCTWGAGGAGGASNEADDAEPAPPCGGSE